MSMTREEKVFDILGKWEFFFGQRAGRELWGDKPKAVQDQDIADFNRDINTVRSALRPVSREPLEKFKEYFDDLYGKGLEIYGWHMNGEAKSFDDFYEDACEYAGL